MQLSMIAKTTIVNENENIANNGILEGKTQQLA